MKKYTYLVLFILLASMLAAGCTGSNSDKNNSQTSLTQPTENTYKNEEWAQNVTEITEILKNDTNGISKAMDNSDWYTTSANLEKYKHDLNNAVTSSDSFTVSPELQPCKDEYRLGLIDDYNEAILMKTSINLLTSGDFESATNTTELVAEKARSAEYHYENVTSLLNSYNKDHQSAPLNLSTLHHNNTQDNTQEKNLQGEDVFDYTNWSFYTTDHVGMYQKAPTGYIYYVVTVQINNTGTQTYSTNPNYWPLSADGIIYDADSTTYDETINHQTVTVAPGGNFETKFVYVVKGNPAKLTLTYNGPIEAL